MSHATSAFPTHDLAATPTIEHTHLSQFEALEKLIRNYQGAAPRSDIVNQYVDTGIELAADAGVKGFNRLQESWLRRMYTTLRDTGLNHSCSAAWRSVCLESLYQPFFALMHIYRERPDGHLCLRAMSNKMQSEMQLISRYIL